MVAWVFPGIGFDGGPAVVAARIVVAGPGVACPKSWSAGCEPAALESESFPGCPPGPAACGALAARRAWVASIRPGMGQFVARLRREMDVPEQVEAYLASQPEPKQADLRRLHAHILAEFPGCRLWFTDGTNADGKVVANPNIGYGAYTIAYADGWSRGFIVLA